jgi:FkbM family methyltransferase
MKLEEKIKKKYLYSNKLNFFKLIFYFAHYIKSIIHRKIIYSNWSIDLAVDFFFKNKKKGIYIDVGCHLPLLNNNTLLLYRRGWSGINIDLDYNAIDTFNFLRKRDTNIQTCISNNEEEKELFFFHSRSAKNTLNQQRGYGAREILKIQTKTLNSIIQKSTYADNEIDFLSLDVEGSELDVLKGFDIDKYKPKIIVAEFIPANINEFYEVNINDIINSDLYIYLTNKNYKLINWIHDDLMFMRK